MRKQNLLTNLLFLLFISLSSFFASLQAQITLDTIPVRITAEQKPQTPPYLSSTDTIIVQSLGNIKYFERILQPGQTLWSLSRYFGLRPRELYALNPSLDTEQSKPGSRVRIPLPNKAIKRFENKDFNKNEYAPICYIVKKGDTVYGIAQRSYKMPLDTLINRNKIQNNTLKLGQKIHTGWISIAGIPDSLQNHKALLSYEKGSWNVKQYEEERRRYNQRGPAVYLQSKGKGRTVSVLHNKARVGSLIEIHCPETKKKIFAKVIGKIPRGAHDPDIVAVLSFQAAKMLGVKNRRFFVEIKH